MAWAPDYVTTAELKDYTRIPGLDTVDDTTLAFAISAASRAIDRETNRQFGQVALAEERKYTARWDRRRNRWVVDIDDLMTESGLTVSVDAGTITDFTLQPINAEQVSQPWTRIIVNQSSTIRPVGDENGVAITALWGWTTVPDAIKQGTLLQASRIFSRRTSPFGVAGSPDQGSELRLLAKVDPDVAVIVGPYVRWWAAV